MIPKWIRPKEIITIKYWAHLGVLAFVVLSILQLLKIGDMFSLKNFLISLPILAIGDVVAHTLLKID